MELINYNINKLNEIKHLFKQIEPELYTNKRDILNKATIGQHFRHILEFYLCIKNGVNCGIISYDERERNELIENNLNYSLNVIEDIIKFLHEITIDKKIILKASYSNSTVEPTNINTSLFRELAYALDHTIHHLAIIKIALINENITLDSNFGVAPSTVRYRKECAQ